MEFIVYLDMLINYCFPRQDELENIQQFISIKMTHPPNFSVFFKYALNEKFGHRGEAGKDLCPGMTSCNFFLWEYIKNIAYGQKIRSLNH